MTQLIKLSRELVEKLQTMPGIHPSHYQELADWFAKAGTFASPQEIRAAREGYASDDIDIDEPAIASRTDDGLWVQAWVWLEVA